VLDGREVFAADGEDGRGVRRDVSEGFVGIVVVVEVIEPVDAIEGVDAVDTLAVGALAADTLAVGAAGVLGGAGRGGPGGGVGLRRPGRGEEFFAQEDAAAGGAEDEVEVVGVVDFAAGFSGGVPCPVQGGLGVLDDEGCEVLAEVDEGAQGVQAVGGDVRAAGGVIELSEGCVCVHERNKNICRGWRARILFRMWIVFSCGGAGRLSPGPGG
jgi:hypothetical protein